MGHGPATNWGKDHAVGFKSRLGIYLFILYALIYALFVALNVVSPDSMNLLIGEQNLAVVYGFGLIVGALLLGLIYNTLCSKAEDRMNKVEE